MMDLDQQIQVLLQDAPNDPEMRQITEMFAPILKQFASKLGHLHYYVAQTLDQNWVSVTLSHRTQPNVEKNVLYAFSTLQDVSLDLYPQDTENLVAVPIRVIDLLFQFFALNLADSIIFFDIPGNIINGVEVSRMEMEQALLDRRNRLPPDVA
jgi:hypothetical protein